MPVDNSDFLRRAVVATWKGFAPLLAFVPAARIFPPQRPPQPAWPFVAYGVPIVGPFSASCMDGNTVSFAGHAYAETTGEGAETVMGEPRARDIAAAMAAPLDAPLDLQAFGCPVPAVAHVTWTGTQVIQDSSEADRWHGIASFEAFIVS